MRIFNYLLIVVSCTLAAGCFSAQGKLSGTGIVTPYGTANSINSELNVASTEIINVDNF